MILLALDFGGTKLTAATVDSAAPAAEKPAWRAYRRVFSPTGGDAQYDIRTMVALGKELLAGQRPRAVGVSFGGPADFARGHVIRSDHVPGWEETPLQALLAAEFDAPVRLDNDANVAALGEHRFGAGRGYDHLLYVTISTGVGGGWILDGRPWRGPAGVAGEIGHVVIDPHGPPCLCGKRGCVERFASGPYMAQDAAERLAREPQRGAVLRKLSQETVVTGEMVATAAAQGDELAREILQRGAWALGIGLGNAANLICPQRFVLGGGVTKSGPLWWDVVRRVARETALADVIFDVVPAALGDDAPLWGAVALVEALAAADA